MSDLNIKSYFYLGLFILTALFCVACATDPRIATSQEIEQQVALKTKADNQTEIWSAPELRVSHFRIRFYGYDTVDYYLIAEKSLQQADAKVFFRLKIDANYGSPIRHYDIAHQDNGLDKPIEHMDHQSVRCQLFSDMYDGCLYRDRGDIELSLAELEKGRIVGINFTVKSSERNYEQIDLPPHYINGFLNVVLKP